MNDHRMEAEFEALLRVAGLAEFDVDRSGLVAYFDEIAVAMDEIRPVPAAIPEPDDAGTIES